MKSILNWEKFNENLLKRTLGNISKTFNIGDRYTDQYKTLSSKSLSNLINNINKSGKINIFGKDIKDICSDLEKVIRIRTGESGEDAL